MATTQLDCGDCSLRHHHGDGGTEGGREATAVDMETWKDLFNTKSVTICLCHLRVDLDWGHSPELVATATTDGQADQKWKCSPRMKRDLCIKCFAGRHAARTEDVSVHPERVAVAKSVERMHVHNLSSGECSSSVLSDWVVGGLGGRTCHFVAFPRILLIYYSPFLSYLGEALLT